jgi:hypothetical protein
VFGFAGVRGFIPGGSGLAPGGLWLEGRFVTAGGSCPAPAIREGRFVNDSGARAAPGVLSPGRMGVPRARLVVPGLSLGERSDDTGGEDFRVASIGTRRNRDFTPNSEESTAVDGNAGAARS